MNNLQANQILMVDNNATFPEIKYAYSPNYFINDADDTKAITAYAESGGLLWFTVASMSATAGDWILIRGSDRWNGLHQVNATISGATAIVTKTK